MKISLDCPSARRLTQHGVKSRELKASRIFVFDFQFGDAITLPFPILGPVILIKRRWLVFRRRSTGGFCQPQNASTRVMPCSSDSRLRWTCLYTAAYLGSNKDAQHFSQDRNRRERMLFSPGESHSVLPGSTGRRGPQWRSRFARWEWQRLDRAEAGGHFIAVVLALFPLRDDLLDGGSGDMVARSPGAHATVGVC